MEEVKLLIPDENGYLFHIPPREPWKRFWNALKEEKKYIPEDDIPLIFRKVR